MLLEFKLNSMPGLGHLFSIIVFQNPKNIANIADGTHT